MQEQPLDRMPERGEFTGIIVNLQAANIKRLVAIEISPDRHIVELRGKNAAGKSSVIDAIAYALGGKALCPDDPIRHGEKVGYVEVDLGDLVVRRTFTDKSSYLSVKNKDGWEPKSPQKILDELVGTLTFDPLAFSRMALARQRNTLIVLTGIGPKLKEIDDEIERVFAGRKIAKRDVDRIMGGLAQLPIPPDDTPAEPVSIPALADALEAAMTTQGDNDSLREGIAAYEERNADTIGDIEAIEARMEQLKEDIKSAEAVRRNLEAVLDRGNAELKAAAREVEALTDPDIAEIRGRIAAAEDLNAHVRMRVRKNEMDAELDDASKHYGGLDRALTRFRNQRKGVLETTVMPIDGLAITPDGVTFGDVPLDQCSSAEQLRISVNIAMACNPKLRVLLVRDGSLLDDDSLAALYETVRGHDYQLWIERVGEGDGGLIIEDGRIKGVPAVPDETALVDMKEERGAE